MARQEVITTLFLALSLSCSLALLFSLSLCLTLSLSLFLALYFAFSLSFFLARSLSFFLARSLSFFLARSLVLPLWLSLFRSLSIALLLSFFLSKYFVCRVILTDKQPSKKLTNDNHSLLPFSTNKNLSKKSNVSPLPVVPLCIVSLLEITLQKLVGMNLLDKKLTGNNLFSKIRVKFSNATSKVCPKYLFL